MGRRERRSRNAALARRYKSAGAELRSPFKPVPRSAFPKLQMSREPYEAFVSEGLLIQVYAEGGGFDRLSIQRKDGKDGLLWDDLSWAVNQVRPGRWAVEVFPPADQIMNVANMRHLWVYPKDLACPFDLYSAAEQHPGRGQ